MQRWSVRGLWGGARHDDVRMHGRRKRSQPRWRSTRRDRRSSSGCGKAVALDEDLSWEGRRAKRWPRMTRGSVAGAGEWTTELALPEDDPGGWAEREQRLDAVLQGAQAGRSRRPGYAGGSAYGFETASPAVGVLGSTPGRAFTTIRLHGEPRSRWTVTAENPH